MIITAMRQALEALEAHADIGIKSDKAITALRTAIEQAEKQEPVAWMDASETALSWENYLDGMKPLYTTPPAAQWVGLTQEDIAEIAEKLGLADVAWVDLMQAIERRLKRRNT